MRRLVVVLLMYLLFGHSPVFAAGPTGGVLMTAAVREAARLASAEALPAQAGTTQKKGSAGHPVLKGALIGAGAGAAVGYFGSSCSTPPPDDDLACGTHYKEGAAVLGAALGAGVGALIGLAFRR
jgi:hypothetical protein